MLHELKQSTVFSGLSTKGDAIASTTKKDSGNTTCKATAIDGEEQDGDDEDDEIDLDFNLVSNFIESFSSQEV